MTQAINAGFSVEEALILADLDGYFICQTIQDVSGYGFENDLYWEGDEAFSSLNEAIEEVEKMEEGRVIDLHWNVIYQFKAPVQRGRGS